MLLAVCAFDLEAAHREHKATEAGTDAASTPVSMVAQQAANGGAGSGGGGVANMRDARGSWMVRALPAPVCYYGVSG